MSALTAIGFSNQPKGPQNIEEIMAQRRFANNKGIMDVQKQFDDHIKLLCASIKNQVPGDNIDPDKFMQTSFQMMNTEQIILMNQRMSETNDLQKKLSKIEMSKFLNKEVKVETESFVFEQKPIELSYKLGEKVSNPIFEIYSANNLKEPIQSMALNPNDSEGNLLWNGQLPNGEIAQSGQYILKVSGTSLKEKDIENNPITIHGKTAIFTVLDSIYAEDDSKEQMFTSGKMLINEQDIKMVRKKQANPYENKIKQNSTYSQTDETPFQANEANEGTSTVADATNLNFSTTSAIHEQLAQQYNQEV